PVSSAPPDPKVATLSLQLDQLDTDLANTEQSMLSQLRTPVSRSDPAGDLAKKLKAQEQAAEALKALEQQIQTAQADLQPLLSTNPSSTSSGLPFKLSAASSKYDILAALVDLYNKKANASLSLVGQIQKMDSLVSGFQRNLSEDDLISDIPNAIQIHTEAIQRQQRSVGGVQEDMIKLNQDLETTEKLCSSLQQGYQEYCPDIQRQRKDVKQLEGRYANVTNQLKERVMKGLRQKEDDIGRVTVLSQDLQILLNVYEANAHKYNSTLEDVGMTLPKRVQMLTLADAIGKEEKQLVNRYAEATAENIQRQRHMVLARNLICQ
ncbi:hypothetical protein XENOCAPTIV_012099, partial [Xenoophorus captivus]